MHSSRSSKRRRSSKIDEGKGKDAKPAESRNQEDGDSRISVPAQVLQVIGSHLSVRDLPAARLACKSWSGHICEATTHFSGLIHPCPDAMATKLRNMAHVFPLAASCSFMLSTSVSRAAMSQFLQSLNTNKKIEHLELAFLIPVDPKISTSNIEKRGAFLLEPIASVRNLSSLTLRNAFFPAAEALNAFAALSRLTKLTFDSLDVGKAGAVSSFTTGSSFGPQIKDLAALGALTGLHELSLRSTLGNGAVSELTCLSQLSRLTRLEVSGGLTVGKLVLQSLTTLASLQDLTVTLDAPTTPSAAALHNLVGLKALRVSMPTVSHKPTMEGVQYLLNSFPSSLQGLTLRAVQTTFVASELYPLLSHANIQDFALCLSQGSHTNDGITQLTSLRSLSISKLRGGSCDMQALFSGLPSSWGSSLQKLTLESFTSTELHTSSLQQLSQLHSLKELTVIGADNTPLMMQLDFGTLPCGLERLDLKFVFMTCPVQHQRLAKLETLALRRCSLSCFNHFQTAVEGLAGLRSLDLDDIDGLTDGHLEKLACLTQLTSLGVAAIGNPRVTNHVIRSLSPLVQLHRLRWHAGDMLDFPIDLSHLYSFSKLCILCIPNSMIWRLSRGYPVGKMKELPYFEIECVN